MKAEMEEKQTYWSLVKFARGSQFLKVMEIFILVHQPFKFSKPGAAETKKGTVILFLQIVKMTG